MWLPDLYALLETCHSPSKDGEEFLTPWFCRGWWLTCKDKMQKWCCLTSGLDPKWQHGFHLAAFSQGNFNCHVNRLTTLRTPRCEEAHARLYCEIPCRGRETTWRERDALQPSADCCSSPIHHYSSCGRHRTESVSPIARTTQLIPSQHLTHRNREE